MTQRQEIENGTRRTCEGLEACARLLRKLSPYLARLLIHAKAADAAMDPVAALTPGVLELDDLVRELSMHLGRQRDGSAVVATPAPAAAAVSAADADAPDSTPSPPSASNGAATQIGSLMHDLDDSAARGAIDDEGCTLRGVSPNLPISTLLQFLSSEAKSGMLCVATADERFTVQLQRGHVIHAISDSTPLDERLGSLLLKRGVLGAEQLTDLLERSRAEGVHLGTMLEEEQIVAVEDLHSALEEQVQLLFRRLFAQRDAQFAFYEDIDSNPEIHVNLDMTTLLLESARSNDEGQKQPLGAWEDWLQ